MGQGVLVVVLLMLCFVKVCRCKVGINRIIKTNRSTAGDDRNRRNRRFRGRRWNGLGLVVQRVKVFELKAGVGRVQVDEVVAVSGGGGGFFEGW